MGRSQRLALLTGFGLILIAVTYFVAMQVLTRVTEERVEGVLATIRDTTHEGLVVWMDDIKRQVTGWAASPILTAHVRQLLDTSSDPGQLASHPTQRAIRDTLGPVSMEDHSRGYFIVSPDNLILASSNPEEVGTPSVLADYPQYSQALFEPRSFVSIPLAYTGPSNQTEAVILAGAPISSTYGPVIAGLVFYIDPVVDFSRILQSGRLLSSGETYAVSDAGLLVSESRFDEQLRAAGIIAPDQPSILNISISDPGANLLKGEAATPPDQRQLTVMAASLLQRQTDSNVNGYRDYRGVQVVGAWTWNEEYGFGIATEADWDESFANVTAIQPLLTMLSLISGAALVGTVVLSNLAERRERVAQKRYELTVEGAMDAIISFDAADQITSWNPQAEVMFWLEEKRGHRQILGHPYLARRSEGTLFPTLAALTG